MADKTIPNNGKELLMNSGVNSLPNNPSQIGFNAREIKAAMNRQAAIIYDWLDEIDTIQAESDAALVVHKANEETISGKKTFTGGASFTTANVNFGSEYADNAKTLDIWFTTQFHTAIKTAAIIPGNTGFNLGSETKCWYEAFVNDLYLYGKIKDGMYEWEMPAKNGTVALTSDLTTKADLVGGKVPAEQLPSYVDDVLEYANYSGFPATGEQGKIYVALDTNFTYRWSGTAYVRVNETDLSDYYTKSQTDSAIDADVAALSGQVADGTVVAGKASKDASGNPITSTYATKAESAALDSKISKNAEDIATLTEALIKKDLYETQEATFLGMTPVPAGAMAKAYLDGFKGNSAVVNQLFLWTAGGTNNDITYTNNGDGSWTLNGTATADSYLQLGNTSIGARTGHAILYGFANVSSAISGVKLRDGYSGMNTATLQIGTFLTGYSTFQGRITVANGTTLFNVKLIPILVDLTQWFGAGNEPTTIDDPRIVSLLRKMPIPPNAGTLTDSKPTKLYSRNAILASLPLKSIGAVDLGTLDWNYNNGRYYTNDLATVIKRPSGGNVAVNAYIAIYTALPTNDQITVDKSFCVSTATGGLYVTDSAYTAAANADTYKAAMSGIYIYYELATPSSTISQAVIAGLVEHEYDLTMPYLKSAGSVQDESKAGGEKVGKDDLGDLSYSAQTNYNDHCFGATLSDAKSVSSGDTIANLLSKYPTIANSSQPTASSGISLYQTYMRISDPAFVGKTATEVKGLLTGTKINYELAAPTDFTDPISYPEIFDVYAGGSVEVMGDGCDATTKVYFYVEA